MQKHLQRQRENNKNITRHIAHTTVWWSNIKWIIFYVHFSDFTTMRGCRTNILIIIRRDMDTLKTHARSYTLHGLNLRHTYRDLYESSDRIWWYNQFKHTTTETTPQLVCVKYSIILEWSDCSDTLTCIYLTMSKQFYVCRIDDGCGDSHE